MFALILLVFALILILTIIIMGLVIFMKIKNKVSQVSQLAFGTSDVLEGFKKAEMEYEATPKSVSAGTGIYLPQIKRDFPDFHYEEMRSRAINVLESYLQSVDTKDAGRLSEGTNELKENLRLRIQNMDFERNEHFRDITIHQAEINRYMKSAGRCSILFQISLKYKHYIEDKGKIIKGSPDHWEQSRYNVEVIYIQNQDLVANSEVDGLGLVCPNCGAPIGNLGVKVCPYCDGAVIEFNLKTWGFSKVVEG